MDSFHFEWDQNKNQSNHEKHAVSFEEAQTVFYDENAIEYYDQNHSSEEERFIMLGISYQLSLLVVCYCIRKHNAIRIISARKATKKEAKAYGKGI
ncbi:MAG TPA: BrnT family toxin [Thiotrichaceae bacterium]|nr:BrnT family toxin [Thiotrichaceae bacterium]